MKKTTVMYFQIYLNRISIEVKTDMQCPKCSNSNFYHCFCLYNLWTSEISRLLLRGVWRLGICGTRKMDLHKELSFRDDSCGSSNWSKYVLQCVLLDKGFWIYHSSEYISDRFECPSDTWYPKSSKKKGTSTKVRLWKCNIVIVLLFLLFLLLDLHCFAIPWFHNENLNFQAMSCT